MKTADDILSNFTQAYVDDPRSLFEWKYVIEAMKDYAKEVAKEALQGAAEKSYIMSDNINGIRRVREAVRKEDILNTQIITP